MSLWMNNFYNNIKNVFRIPATLPAIYPAPTTLHDNLQCISIAQTKCTNETADLFLCQK